MWASGAVKHLTVKVSLRRERGTRAYSLVTRSFSKGNHRCFLFHKPTVAFQLKRCPPPPAVPQADLLTEDEDFAIGNASLLSSFHAVESGFS